MPFTDAHPCPEPMAEEVPLARVLFPENTSNMRRPEDLLVIQIDTPEKKQVDVERPVARPLAAVKKMLAENAARRRADIAAAGGPAKAKGLGCGSS